ncbi:hypothetical protein PFISCL1PPCAC_21944, partial [Pristionchus fissidentatus]
AFFTFLLAASACVLSISADSPAVQIRAEAASSLWKELKEVIREASERNFMTPTISNEGKNNKKIPVGDVLLAMYFRTKRDIFDTWSKQVRDACLARGYNCNFAWTNSDKKDKRGMRTTRCKIRAIRTRASEASQVSKDTIDLFTNIAKSYGKYSLSSKCGVDQEVTNKRYPEGEVPCLLKLHGAVSSSTEEKLIEQIAKSIAKLAGAHTFPLSTALESSRRIYYSPAQIPAKSSVLPFSSLDILIDQ